MLLELYQRPLGVPISGDLTVDTSTSLLNLWSVFFDKHDTELCIGTHLYESPLPYKHEDDETEICYAYMDT